MVNLVCCGVLGRALLRCACDVRWLMADGCDRCDRCDLRWSMPRSLLAARWLPAASAAWRLASRRLSHQHNGYSVYTTKAKRTATHQRNHATRTSSTCSAQRRSQRCLVITGHPFPASASSSPALPWPAYRSWSPRQHCRWGRRPGRQTAAAREGKTRVVGRERRRTQDNKPSHRTHVLAHPCIFRHTRTQARFPRAYGGCRVGERQLRPGRWRGLSSGRANDESEGSEETGAQPDRRTSR